MPCSREYVSRFTHDWGGFCSSDAHNKPGTAIYFLGIIDILQDYNLRKQLEHGIKALQYEGVRVPVLVSLSDALPIIGSDLVC